MYIRIFINLDIYAPRLNSKFKLVSETEPVIKTAKKKNNTENNQFC